jgi:hypothetical protein
VDIEGLPLQGTAASSITRTYTGTTRLGTGKAGKGIEFVADSDWMDYGVVPELHLSTMTGLIVVEMPATSSGVILFSTRISGSFTEGFVLRILSSGIVNSLKQDTIELGSSVGTVRKGGVSNIAWSYNNVSGLFRFAVDGVFNSFSAPQTFTHYLVGRNRYYDYSPVQAGSHKQYLFALSAECDKVSSAELVGWSLNPWQIFKAPARRFPVAPLGGTTHDLIGIGQISSAEAFGTSALSAGITSSGVAAGAALGNAGLTVEILTAGIATAEAIGSTAVVAAVSAAGIETTEAEGSPQLAAGIAGSSIASTETFGNGTLTTRIQAGGITSTEAVGAPEVGGVAAANVIGVGAIASAEVSGSPAVSVIVESAGITAAEALGQPAVGVPAASVNSAGQIATGEAFGSPAAALAVAVAGIASAETTGNAAVVVAINAAGNIATTEVVGVPLVGEASPQEISGAGGILSAEAFGSANIHPLVPYTGTGFQQGSGHRPIRQHRQPVPVILAHRIGAAGIESAERFGYPTLTWRGRTRRIREEEFLLGRAA